MTSPNYDFPPSHPVIFVLLKQNSFLSIDIINSSQAIEFSLDQYSLTVMNQNFSLEPFDPFDLLPGQKEGETTDLVTCISMSGFIWCECSDMILTLCSYLLALSFPFLVVVG